MGWTSKPSVRAFKKLFVKLSLVEKVIFDCLKSVFFESLDKIAIGTQKSIS
tara:strand:- start:185 stop:337 length:153 start_codon:yes stop_codon:yes gene_type:complete